MLADLPPTGALTDTVNEVVADLGVGRPAVLDGADRLLDLDGMSVDACLDLGAHVALDGPTA